MVRVATLRRMMASGLEGIAALARESVLLRRVRNALHFRKGLFVTLGDRNPSFYRPGWVTVDLAEADVQCDLRSEDLPFATGSVDAMHSSHLVEHLSSDQGARLFREVHRCLKAGGYFRVVTPDMDLLLERYRDRDWRFFLKANGPSILSGIRAGRIPPESLLMYNQLVGWFASYSGGGGPIVNEDLVKEKLDSSTKYEFRDWCTSLLEPGRTPAHVHLYDFDELSAALGDVGFQDVQQLSWGESGCSEMLDPPIDRRERRIYSLYVEARK